MGDTLLAKVNTAARLQAGTCGSRKSWLHMRPRARVRTPPFWVEIAGSTKNKKVEEQAAIKATGSRTPTYQDVRSHSPTLSPTGRRLPVTTLQCDEESWASEAIGLDSSGGCGRVDSSAEGSPLSAFSSMSESQGSNTSRIDVHDFLEESSGSGGDDEGEEEGEGRVDGIAGDEKEGLVSKGQQMGLLDAEDIAFLMGRRELQDAMLRVEDLHFGEAGGYDWAGENVGHQEGVPIRRRLESYMRPIKSSLRGLPYVERVAGTNSEERCASSRSITPNTTHTPVFHLVT